MHIHKNNQKEREEIEVDEIVDYLVESGYGGARELTAPLPSAIALHPIRIPFLMIRCGSAPRILVNFFFVWYFELVHILKPFLDFIIAVLEEPRVNGPDIAKSIEK